MVKEVNVILIGFLMALFLVVSNSAYVLYQVEDPMNLISGSSIKETITEFYDVSSVNHRAFFLLQFILLFILVISFFVIIRKFKSKAKLSKYDFVKKGCTKSGTDLDILYEILKSKKEINIDDIGKVFKVNLDIALEWSKILEDGNLAMIDYPRFGKPVLKLLEENNEEESTPKKDTENKKNIDHEKVKKKIKNVLHKKDVDLVKKTITQKNIFKKEMRKNLKIEKRTEKKIKKEIKKKSKKK